MRRFRKAVDIGLPIAGNVLILGTVLLISEVTVQVPVVLIGILMIEAGIFKLAHPLLPNERKYLALRAEVDDFIGLVRRLNRAALALRDDESTAAREAVREVTRAMQESLERMELVAGKTEGEVAGLRPPAAPSVSSSG
ncbi:MAG: hypothetical protein HY561_02890 [Gemmatimonadetes bacterium]|nr:hypothetical protein [Gemmatimonadota bacterium]